MSVVRIVLSSLLITCTLSSAQWESRALCGLPFDVSVTLGVAPLRWQRRSSITVQMEVANPDGDMLGPAVDGVSLMFDAIAGLNFGALLRTPLTVGGAIGCRLTDRVRIYLEAMYTKARARHSDDTKFILLPATMAPLGSTLNLCTGNYALADVSFGVQYFFCPWHEIITPFIEGQLGLVHHREVQTNLSVTIVGLGTIIFVPDSQAIFAASNKTIGGIGVGFNCNVGCNGVLEFRAQCLGCAGRSVPKLIPTSESMQITSVRSFRSSGTGVQLRFPVTATFRYEF